MQRPTLNPVRVLIVGGGLGLLVACGPSAEQRQAGVAAFSTVAQVFQHPRCSNCHIPGDTPLQGDGESRRLHPQQVLRGAEGKGAAGLPCSTCHGESNLPASYGPHTPPGAPHWSLPPPDQRMAWIDASAAELCAMITDPQHNGGRDLAALRTHVNEDALVLWGWAPGTGRTPVEVPHAEFMTAFDRWMESGAACPPG
jgi:hypothetical protein